MSYYEGLKQKLVEYTNELAVLNKELQDMRQWFINNDDDGDGIVDGVITSDEQKHLDEMQKEINRLNSYYSQVKSELEAAGKLESHGGVEHKKDGFGVKVTDEGIEISGEEEGEGGVAIKIDKDGISEMQLKKIMDKDKGIQRDITIARDKIQGTVTRKWELKRQTMTLAKVPIGGTGVSAFAAYTVSGSVTLGFKGGIAMKAHPHIPNTLVASAGLTAAATTDPGLQIGLEGGGIIQLYGQATGTMSLNGFGTANFDLSQSDAYLEFKVSGDLHGDLGLYLAPSPRALKIAKKMFGDDKVNEWKITIWNSGKAHLAFLPNAQYMNGVWSDDISIKPGRDVDAVMHKIKEAYDWLDQQLDAVKEAWDDFYHDAEINYVSLWLPSGGDYTPGATITVHCVLNLKDDDMIADDIHDAGFAISLRHNGQVVNSVTQNFQIKHHFEADYSLSIPADVGDRGAEGWDVQITPIVKGKPEAAHSKIEAITVNV